MSDPSTAAPLGIAGYTFGDLHEPERLSSLYDRFCEEAQAADPALWRDWDAYRRAPDAPLPPVALSNLLVAMASHVSRFVTRLFTIDGAARLITEQTRAQDDLFRFKVDFVRRRALPLLKGGAHVQPSPDDDQVVRRLVDGIDGPPRGGPHAPDLELAVARAGCVLMDREKTDKAAVAAEIDALKRWCAARVHDPAYRGWVVFRFPENLDYWHLVARSDARPWLALAPA